MRRFFSLDDARSFLSCLVSPEKWLIYSWNGDDYSCYFVVSKCKSELHFLFEHFPDAKEVI